MHDPTRVEVPLSQRSGHVNPLNRTHDNVAVVLGHSGFRTRSSEVVFVLHDAALAQQVIHKMNEYNRTRPDTYMDEHSTQVQLKENAEKLRAWQELHPGGIRAARCDSYTFSMSPILSSTEIRTMDLLP